MQSAAKWFSLLHSLVLASAVVMKTLSEIHAHKRVYGATLSLHSAGRY